MEKSILVSLKRLQSDAHNLRNTADSFAKRLDLLVAEHAKTAPADEPSEFKRSDGRLSDVGINAMEAMFAEGRTVTEVAKAFDCTVSAASNRKRIWQAKAGASV